MSFNLLVSGAAISATAASGASLVLNPFTASAPSARGLVVFGFTPSEGCFETLLVTSGNSDAACEILETEVCPPAGFDFLFFEAIEVLLLGELIEGIRNRS
jgi:hypothetical protein